MAAIIPNWIIRLAYRANNFFDRYLFRYLNVIEVGERWAMFNNLMFFFCVCVGLLYLAKPWGLTKWNRNVVKNKRRLRALAFRKLHEELSQADDSQQENRRRIVGLDFFQLKDELQNERVSAVEVIDAYRWKALECQEKYNCIVEFVKEAPMWAQKLDAEYKGRTKPALFGMPFSVKESFCLIGYDCSRGLAKELEWPMKEECTLVSHLRQLGAVPLVRTTIPQTLLSFMCSSPAYGTTLNPFDVTRTPGGSSGGETCLIAAGGCPFGIGSDIGGSMRIPTHFCGVTSLKPTSGRLKANGVRHGTPGIVKLGWACGFFTPDVASQTFLLESTMVPEYFERVPQTVPLPFDNSKLVTPTNQPKNQRLRIGYYDEDGWFPSTPAVKRAVQMARRILESAGHELVPFAVPEPSRAIGLILRSILPDNGAYWLNQLKYEDVDQYLKITKRMLSIPLWIRCVASRAVGAIDRKSGIVIGSYVRDLADSRATNEEADLYTIRWLDSYREARLDALIGTVLPFPAVQHEYPTKLSQAVLGTGLYNLLDLPAGVLKVTEVTEVDEREAVEAYPTKAAVEAFFKHPMYKMVRTAMKGSQGLPVGVQVITGPYREEMCLRVMKLIEDGVNMDEKVE